MFKELIEQSLNEAKAARAALNKVNGVVVGKMHNPDQGLYLVNYANLLMNRQIDIFDDALLLCSNYRAGSSTGVGSVHHVHPKIPRVRMGHEKYESTEVNLRFFALDVAASYQVQFTLDTTNAL
ncbi:TPA: hypothetical protein ACGIMR_000718 [Salmonella enterica subsp. enterica serovar Javiana]